MRMNSGMTLTASPVSYVEGDNSGGRPERWESLPEAVLGLPSIYGHLLTFIAGPHACIGYRFAVLECVKFLHYSCLAEECGSADVFIV